MSQLTSKSNTIQHVATFAAFVPSSMLALWPLSAQGSDGGAGVVYLALFGLTFGLTTFVASCFVVFLCTKQFHIFIRLPLTLLFGVLTTYLIMSTGPKMLNIASNPALWRESWMSHPLVFMPTVGGLIGVCFAAVWCLVYPGVRKKGFSSSKYWFMSVSCIVIGIFFGGVWGLWSMWRDKPELLSTSFLHVHDSNNKLVMGSSLP